MSQMTFGGLVLAGGSARRMGGNNKALLKIAGNSFLQRISLALEDFQELLLSTNDPSLAEGTPFTPIADRIPGRGPLEGICAALSVCKSDGLVVTACDMPLLSKELVHHLTIAAQGKTAIACVDRQGNLHPLCGVYTKACLPEIESALCSGMLQVTHVFNTLGGVPFYLETVSLPDSLLMNVNTPENFAQIINMYENDHASIESVKRLPK